MRATRREWFAACAAGWATWAAGAVAQQRLGVVIHSFGIRSSADRKRRAETGINDPLTFLEHCRSLGAGGIQTSIGNRDAAYVRKLRNSLESGGLYLEGSVRLPQDQADCDRFRREVQTAREAGVSVLRTVMLSGRRYETFDSLERFQQWAARATRSLEWAEKIVAEKKMLLAVENHKDWRSDELVNILKKLDSRFVGTCVDTGNSIALLEDPLETARLLAPWAFTTHLKDMAVAEHDGGFLLSEVPLGTGFLDLPGIIALLQKARPGIRFNLEMITRDPLQIPCLNSRYWTTFGDLPGRHLAQTLTMVRKHKSALPRISGLPLERQLAQEQANVEKSLVYAHARLLT